MGNVKKTANKVIQKMSAFQLAWNEFNSCTSKTFRDLYTDKEFTDVTLATEDGQQLKAHKVILSSCSTFFKRILLNNPHQHPLLFLKGVKYSHLKSVLQFIYLGQAEVEQEDLQHFMDSAKELEIQGLVEIPSSTETKTETPCKEVFSRNAIVTEDYGHSETIEDVNYFDQTENQSEEFRKYEISEIKVNGEAFQCSQCNYQTRKRDHLRRHLDSIHEGKKYPCDQCNYKASQDTNLKRHKRTAHLDSM